MWTIYKIERRIAQWMNSVDYSGAGIKISTSNGYIEYNANRLSYKVSPRSPPVTSIMGDAPPDDNRFSGDRIFPVDNPTTPYWRTELHRFDSYRSTEELPSECDIAIIGSGMAGTSTAYHLVKAAGDNPPSIVVLEARQLCSGATARNGVSNLHPSRTSTSN